MKKILLLSSALLLLFSGIAYAANGEYQGNPIVKVFSEGKEIEAAGVPAQLIDDRVMVPLYMLMELGIKLDFDPQTYSVDVKMPEKVKVVVPTLSDEKIEEISKSIGIVLGADEQGVPFSQGTGFMIEDILVTSAHVVKGASWIGADFGGQRYITNERVFYNEEADIAGYRLSHGPPGLKYSTELPEMYDVVYAIGYPEGMYKVKTGYVLGEHNRDEVTKISSIMKVKDGNSGSPLIDDNGIVRGIVHGSAFDEASMSIAIKHVLDEIN